MRTPNALVVAQTAMTLILLSGAGLMIRSFAARLAAGVGAETRGVVTLRVATPRRFNRAEHSAFFGELQRRAAALPGVEAAATADSIPLSEHFTVTGISIRGRREDLRAGIHTVSPEYFGLFRIPLLRGRTFNDRDRAGNPLVVLINETAARQFFPARILWGGVSPTHR